MSQIKPYKHCKKCGRVIVSGGLCENCKPITNGDKIREMVRHLTDEEPAEFLLESRSRCKLCKKRDEICKGAYHDAGTGLMIGSNRRWAKMRLIDANALIQAHCGACANKEFCAEEACQHYDIRKRIEAAPTIKAEPVLHGRWIVHTTWHGMFGLIHSECSECKFDRNGDLSSWNFCPSCGRDMRATDTNAGGKGGADNG